jgi:hypothetical protein
MRIACKILVGKSEGKRLFVRLCVGGRIILECILKKIGCEFVDWIHMAPDKEVRGLTLLLRVGTLWRCGDGLFFEVPPLASDTLLTTLYPLLENVLQTVDHLEICLEAPFSWFRKAQKSHGARSGLYGECSNGVPPIHFFQAEHKIQFRSRPMQFLSFYNHENGAPRQKRILRDQRSAARFREVGGAL